MDVERINKRWRNLATEGLVIVISILLAFAIDAMWETSRLRQEENAALQAVQSDLSANQESIADYVHIQTTMLAGVDSFLDSNSQELRELAPDSALAVVEQLFLFRTYSPIDAAMTSSDLSLIRNVEVRKGIAAWMSLIEDVNEEILNVHYVRNQLETQADSRILRAYYDLLSSDSTSVGSIPSLLANIFEDPEMTRVLIQKQLVVGVNRMKLLKLAEITDELLSVIEES
jgi:hypothetical protein